MTLPPQNGVASSHRFVAGAACVPEANVNGIRLVMAVAIEDGLPTDRSTVTSRPA